MGFTRTDVEENAYPLGADDLKHGHTYMEEDGDLCLCIGYPKESVTILLYLETGTMTSWKGFSHLAGKFREVELLVSVK